MENLPTLFARSDYVTLHVPLLDETRNMINDESLKAFRPRHRAAELRAPGDRRRSGAVARARIGPVGALLLRLSVAAAGATVQRLGNAASRREHGRGGGELRGDGGGSADRFPAQRQHPQLGQLPDGQPRTHRRCPASPSTNRNVPEMLGQILSVLANKNINVIDMINKSRGDVAYNLIDVAAPIPRRPVAGNQPDRQRDERARVRAVSAVKRGRRGADRAAPAATETASIRMPRVPRACTARIRR